MKKVLLIVGIGFLVLMQSCKGDDDIIPPVIEEEIEPETIIEPEEITVPDGYREVVSNESGLDENIVLSPDQIVVRFNDNLAEDDRNRLREEFFVTAKKTCGCGDNSIELWTINTDLLNIETAVDNLKSKDEEEGVEGDRNFTFSIPTPVYTYPYNEIPPLGPGSELVSSRPGTVNIAIIDTGIDHNRIGSDQKYFYDNKTAIGCDDGLTGKDFTGSSESSSNQFIMDINGHGTYVAKLIMSTLDEKNVDYKILPIKAFNGDGKGNYKNIVCAMNYIKNFSDIHIVNASFGGKLKEENTQLLKKIINDLGDQNVLVVCSAGNKGLNTDIPENLHFPSGYDSRNILSVGGYDFDTDKNIEIFSDGKVTNIFKHEFSNYGTTSIDLVTSFARNRIQFMGFGRASNEFIRLSGTSYSAAYITAQIGIRLDQNNFSQIGIGLKQALLEEALFSEELKTEINNGKVLLLESSSQ